jgi:hypothetical protein
VDLAVNGVTSLKNTDVAGNLAATGIVSASTLSATTTNAGRVNSRNYKIRSNKCYNYKNKWLSYFGLAARGKQVHLVVTGKVTNTGSDIINNN